jgi:hypothetical protein
MSLFGQLLGAGGMALGGGAVGTAGNLLGKIVQNTGVGQSLSESFGDSQGYEGMDEALGLAAKHANSLLINTNSAGQRGDAARTGFNIAQQGFTPEAATTSAYNRALSQGDQLGQAGRQQAMAMARAGQMGAGQAVDSAQETVRAMGGPMSAVTAAARAAGQGASQANLQALGQGSQAIQQGLQGAAQLGQTASQNRNAALAQQYERDVKPYWNRETSMQGLGSSLGSTGANIGGGIDSRNETIFNSPLDTLSRGMNYMGGGMFGNALNNMMSEGKTPEQQAQEHPVGQYDLTAGGNTPPSSFGWNGAGLFPPPRRGNWLTNLFN